MIVVIGGGPAGLATAYYLQQHNLPYRVLEKHQIGFAWRQHYDSLHLHTLKQVSALPGLPMPEAYPDFPSRQQVVDYLVQYAQHFNLRVEENMGVEHAEHINGRWHLRTPRERLTAPTIILATGIWSSPVCPTFTGEAQFHGQLLHANQYRHPQPFIGQRVLVVGVGNTGTEIAAELAAAGVETGIVVRSGVNFVPYPPSARLMGAAAWAARHAPSWLSNTVLRLIRPDFSDIGLPRHPAPPVDAFPVVGFELPEAVAAGKVTVYPEIERLLPHGVHFVGGRTAAFDTLILATGYRPTIDFISPTPQLDENGRIANPRQFPGLYTVGFHYPTTEGWLQAIGRAARLTATAAAVDYASRSGQPPI